MSLAGREGELDKGYQPEGKQEGAAAGAAGGGAQVWRCLKLGVLGDGGVLKLESFASPTQRD